MTSKNFIKHIIDRCHLYQYIKNLNINEIINSNNKDSTLLSKKVYKYNIQSNILKIINLLKKYNIKNFISKDFNYLFFIYKYEYNILNNHNFLIDINKIKEIQINLISSVKKLINYMMTFDVYDNFCILKLCNRIKRFKIKLYEWENADNIYLINLYSDTYYHLQDTKCIILESNTHRDLNEDETNEIINIINRQKDMLKKINNLDGMKIFENFQPNKKSKKSIFSKDKYEDDYWLLIKENLNSVPINFHFIKSHLIYLKKILIYITSENKSLLREIDEKLQINNNITDSFYVIYFINYLFDIINKLQNVNISEETKCYQKEFKMNMINGTDLGNFIPFSLKYLTTLFFKIWDTKIKNIKKLLH